MKEVAYLIEWGWKSVKEDYSQLYADCCTLRCTCWKHNVSALLHVGMQGILSMRKVINFLIKNIYILLFLHFSITNIFNLTLKVLWSQLKWLDLTNKNALKISSIFCSTFPSRDFLGLLVCYRAHYSVLENV